MSVIEQFQRFQKKYPSTMFFIGMPTTDHCFLYLMDAIGESGLPPCQIIMAQDHPTIILDNTPIAEKYYTLLSFGNYTQLSQKKYTTYIKLFPERSITVTRRSNGQFQCTTTINNIPGAILLTVQVVDFILLIPQKLEIIGIDVHTRGVVVEQMAIPISFMELIKTGILSRAWI